MQPIRLKTTNKLERQTNRPTNASTRRESYRLSALFLATSLAFITPGALADPAKASVPVSAAQLTRQASREYAHGNYQEAVRLFEKSAQMCQDNGKDTEQLINTLLNLSATLCKSGFVARAEQMLDRAEQLIKDSGNTNNALKIRLYRRRAMIAGQRNNFEDACRAQGSLCELERQYVGALTTAYMGDLGTLQNYQLRNAKYDESIKTGTTLLSLMNNFHLRKEADQWKHYLKNQGRALIAKNRLEEASRCFNELHQRCAEESHEFASTSAAWLIVCARLQKDTNAETFWSKKLANTDAPSSRQSPDQWLGEALNDLKSLRQDQLEASPIREVP